MNKRVALFLIIVGALIVPLAVLDYFASANRADETCQATLELVDSYRFGSAERPLEEENESILRRLEQDKARARFRMQVAGLLGVVIFATGLVFLVGRRSPEPAREAHEGDKNGEHP